ncbi:MAG: RluA family pseudouridine synthase [Deltaproteobacteria bacterium]|nr:RluA family pseudouridine synthase [Deltaproteobacteria bacterium]
MSPNTIPVVHEDARIVVVDKPEGLSSIPERDVTLPSVQRVLEGARCERLFVVHRLDKEVSGLLVFARDAEAHRMLSMAFEDRRVHKTYAAVADGVIAEDGGVIERPIAQFGSGRMGVDERRGKPSRTEFRVLRRRAAHTEVEAHPITGRRHQLRVHFYAIGHPLIGDPRYGDPREQAKWPRLMLHAMRVRIPHPDGGERTFEAAPPTSYRVVVEALP